MIKRVCHDAMGGLYEFLGDQERIGETLKESVTIFLPVDYYEMSKIKILVIKFAMWSIQIWNITSGAFRFLC